MILLAIPLGCGSSVQTGGDGLSRAGGVLLPGGQTIEVVSIGVQPTTAAPGEAVALSATLQMSVTRAANLQLTIDDGDWNKLEVIDAWGAATDQLLLSGVLFDADVPQTFTWPVTLPPDAPAGDYRPTVAVYPQDWSQKVLDHVEPVGSFTITDGTPPPGDTDTAEPPVGSGHVPAGYVLTFADEFDAPLVLDGPGHWSSYFVGWNVGHLAGNADECLKTTGDGTGLGGPPLGLTLHETTGQGTVRLFGRPIPAQQQAQFWGFPYAGGMLSGQLNHAQRYGYWEVRTRLPRTSQGHHWAFWLLGDDDSWPPEVDMLEVVGLDDREFHFNFHWDDNGVHNSVFETHPAPVAPGDWFTLGFEWTDAEMRWSVDGVVMKTEPNREFTRSFYFLVTPEIGGNWPGDPDGSTVWPQEAEIDYVRIYARP